MGQRLKSPCTHTCVRTAGPLIIDRPLNSCYPSPRISFLTGAAYSTRPELDPYHLLRALGSKSLER
jgi:hypothetical protein